MHTLCDKTVTARCPLSCDTLKKYIEKSHYCIHSQADRLQEVKNGERENIDEQMLDDSRLLRGGRIELSGLSGYRSPTRSNGGHEGRLGPFQTSFI